MIDSKFFITCFLAMIASRESEELFEIKSNNNLKGQTKQLFFQIILKLAIGTTIVGVIIKYVLTIFAGVFQITNMIM